jgi:AraC-like DNA-binding protein
MNLGTAWVFLRVTKNIKQLSFPIFSLLFHNYSRHPKIMHRFDATRTDFMPYGFTCELWAPAPMPRPDRHNEIEINLLQSGTLTYLLGGRRTTVQAGRLTLFWAAIPHQIVDWKKAEPYFVATLPLAWFLGCGFPAAFAHPILGGEIVSDPKPLAEDRLKFQQWIADLQAVNPLREKVAQMEIESRLLRLALAMPGRKSAASTSSAPAHATAPQLSRADQLACHIARHYQQPLTATQIAAAVGLHPNYAMALFRKAFGTTMTDFLIQHRISHAQRLLVTTDDPVIEIAAAAGFQSLSRFNEAFKHACGCPPRAYRKTHHSRKHLLIPPPSHPSKKRISNVKYLTTSPNRPN